VPVKVTGSGPAQVRFFVQDSLTGATRSWLTTVRPGQATIPVPVEVAGDTLYGEGERQVVAAKAVRGIVIGDYAGGALVTDDDPAPTLTVAPVAGRVTEGAALTWRFTLSSPVEFAADLYGFALPPAAGTELSSTDVDPAWFAEASFDQSPEPSRPLSEAGVFPQTSIPAGQLTADLTVPTIADTVAEGEEVVELGVGSFSSLTAQPDVVTGTVTD